MFVRFICDWPPYRDGQAVEIPDRVGADFVARCMAQIVTVEEVQSYTRTMETVDRAIEKRISGRPAKSSGRRVISEDEWRRELGQKGPAALRYLPAAITTRS